MRCRAILILWYAGMEGGHALADIVLGPRTSRPAACPSPSPPAPTTCRRSIPMRRSSNTASSTGRRCSTISECRQPIRTASG